MAATLSIFTRAVLQSGGRYHDFLPSTASPEGLVQTVTLADGLRATIDRGIKLKAGTQTVVWEWSQSSGFEWLAFVRNASHVGVVAVYPSIAVRAVTSPTNETPTGARVWNSLATSCFSVFSLDQDRVYFDPDAATHAGDASGLPAMVASGTRALGVVDRVTFFNPGTTDVLIDRWLIQ
ncbi:MAG: hypothetical protein SFZ23_08610 [Planctomycetota bacterium]|nr:hypothetical protein [Planctomycetota bacterium]